MFSGIGITCFSASYGVALGLEVTRLLFRSRIRGAVMLGFAAAGLFAHTLYLCHRAVEVVASPLSSEQDWYLVAAWALAAAYLYLTYYHPKTSFGLIILPLTLALVGVAAFAADPAPFAREPASKAWGLVHGTSILLATVAVLVGFAAGLMHLRQSYRLQHKLPPNRTLRLPSLEWLQRTNSRAIVVSTLMLGVGVLSGMILNLIHHSGHLPWRDPVVLSTLVMFGWLAGAAGVGLFFKSARRGRKVAYLTLVSFVFLVIALGVGLFVETQHGGGRSSVGETPMAHGDHR